MKRITCLLGLLLLASACGGGGAGPDPTGAADDPPPPPPVFPAAVQLRGALEGLPLAEFYDVSYGALISRTPESIVWQSLEEIYPQDEARLNDLSNTFRRETFAMHEVVLELLLAYDRSALSAGEQLDYDVYQWFLQDVVDQLEFIYYDFIATYSLFGVPDETQTLFEEIHPLETAADAEDYVARLGDVLPKFTQIATHLSLQRQAGIVEPALTLNIALGQVRQVAQTPVDNHPYFTRFDADVAKIPGLSPAQREDLTDAARSALLNSVLPGYRRLQTALEGLQSAASPSIGVGQFPRGNEYYPYILRHHTTTDLSPQEVHQLGLAELQRIHAEMRIIFDQLGYPQGESLQQLFARVTTDGGVIPAADVLTTYETIIDVTEQKLDQAFDIFPAVDVIVKPDDFGGYYIGPTLDGKRPGAFYAGTTVSQPWFQMPSLTYHESVPGHHTQIALSMEQDLPPFRKLQRFTAFVEGWALYAERLAYELGWYENDVYGNLGRLQYEALRAARLVIDTGIHHFGWSFNEAARFNVDNVGWSTGASQGAAARYSVIPGQATAYMIGMLQILAARQRAQDELGPRFDLKAFHRVLLSGGAIPLALLDPLVDRYISVTLAE